MIRRLYCRSSKICFSFVYLVIVICIFVLLSLSFAIFACSQTFCCSLCFLGIYFLSLFVSFVICHLFCIFFCSSVKCLSWILYESISCPLNILLLSCYCVL